MTDAPASEVPTPPEGFTTPRAVDDPHEIWQTYCGMIEYVVLAYGPDGLEWGCIDCPWVRGLNPRYAVKTPEEQAFVKHRRFSLDRERVLEER